MNWKDISKELPIDYTKCNKYESCDVLLFDGESLYFDEFCCGNLPEPWWDFDRVNKDLVTHWVRVKEIPTPSLV